MSLSVTGEGARTLLFHTRDVAEFSKRLHDMPQEAEPYPITIERSNDPEWRGFEGVFSDFGPKKPLWQRLFGK